MSKQHRVSVNERVRRERQRHAAQFQRWCERVGQPNVPEALILYRLIGGKRYRASGGDGQQRRSGGDGA